MMRSFNSMILFAILLSSVAYARLDPLSEEVPSPQPEIRDVLSKGLRNKVCMGTEDECNLLNDAYLDACSRGDVDEVKAMLQKGADFQSVDVFKGTCLHISARDGHLKIVNLLVHLGFNVDAKNNGGKAPLHDAAGYGRLGVVKYLLNAGATVDPLDLNKITPLHRAASGGQKKIVELLIARGANIDAVQIQGRTPLFEASFSGYTVVAKVLIDSGADVDVRDSWGKSALWIAAYGGRLSIVKILVKTGAELDYEARMVTDPQQAKITALKVAMLEDRWEVVRFLRAAGAKE